MGSLYGSGSGWNFQGYSSWKYEVLTQEKSFVFTIDFFAFCGKILMLQWYLQQLRPAGIYRPLVDQPRSGFGQSSCPSHFDIILRSDTVPTQGYRSGHNEAVLKTVWGNPRGFESHSLRQKRTDGFSNLSVLFYIVKSGIRRVGSE